MYMRIVQAKIKPEYLQKIQQLYTEKSIPALKNVPGCLLASLIQSDKHQDEVLSITLWDKVEDIEVYQQSGVFEKLMEGAKPYLADTTEWNVQLSEDFTLDYEVVEDEPVIKSLPVVAREDDSPPQQEETQPMHTRIVSIKILPEKTDEFRQIYESEILPAVTAVKGCRYIYLAESKVEDEMYSITIWDSKEDAERYEQGGLFDELTEKVKHTFSGLQQWKMILQKDYDEGQATSKLMKVDHYNVVSGRSFR